MSEYWKAEYAEAQRETVASTIAKRESGFYVKIANPQHLIDAGYPSFYFEVRWNHTQEYPPIKEQTRWSDDWSTIIPYDPSSPPPTKNLGLYQSIIKQKGGVIALGKGRRVLVGDKETEKIVGAGDGFVDIKIATPRIIESVVSITNSWEPDTREKKHGHKPKQEGNS